MSFIKKFYCGQCKEKYFMIRKELRKHLQKEHLIKSDLVSFDHTKKGKLNQPWWKWEKF